MKLVYLVYTFLVAYFLIQTHKQEYNQRFIKDRFNSNMGSYANKNCMKYSLGEIARYEKEIL